MRVLIVDDEQMIRQLAERILSRAGHETVSVSTGREAIDTFGSAPDSFGAVILDLTLDDMGGRECLEQLDAVRRAVPVIISTGHPVSHEDFPDRFREQISILLKPYKASELVALISEVAGSSN